MKKSLVILSLSALLLVSCGTGKNEPLEKQLANNYDFNTMNVEIDDYEDIYQASIKSSFLILNCVDKGKGPQITSTGSGFAYKEFNTDDYYVITNHHVAPDTTRTYFIVTYTGQIVPATLIGTGGDYLDISVLKVKDVEDVQEAKLYCNGDVKNMGNPSVGDHVYALGNPANINLFGSISHGVVSNGKRVIKTKQNQDLLEQDHAIQIDVPINPGNSGGPLFNDNGEIIGVNTFKLTKNNQNENLIGINFALPIHDMLIVADYIIENSVLGFVKYKPFDFGNVNLLDIRNMSLADRKRYKISDKQLDGVFVKYSGNDSLPSKSIITKIEGKDVSDSFDLRRGMMENDDNKINLSIIDREGVSQTIEVTLVK